MIRIFLQNRIWLIGSRVMSSFVQVVISQNEMKLLASVGKMNHLNPIQARLFYRSKVQRGH